MKPRPCTVWEAALAPVVAACVLEPRLCLRVAPQGGGGVIAAGHRLLEPAQLLLDRHQVGGAGKHVIPQRDAAERGRALVVERDAGALLPREVATFEGYLSDECAE